MVNQIDNCELCPLFLNRLEGCPPFKTYGSGQVLIINKKPSEDECMVNMPCSLEYDFLKNNIEYDFKYTFLTRCFGNQNSENIKTCVNNWLIKEIENYKIVFGLGIEVCYYLLPIKRKTKIEDILGKVYKINNTIFIPNYNVNFVMNRNKKIEDKFLGIFHEKV